MAFHFLPFKGDYIAELPTLGGMFSSHFWMPRSIHTLMLWGGRETSYLSVLNGPIHPLEVIV